jgi:hypothetical protein
MTDQTPDLAALEALAEAATPGPWRQAPWHMVNVMPKAWAEDVQPIEDRGPFMCITTSGGSSDMAANRREAEVLAAYVAAADPSTVLWLIREVKRLREPLDDLEIINGWLVQRGVHEPEYPAGVAYGPMPYSDAEPLVDLSTLSGWPDITRAEKAEATIERVRALVADWQANSISRDLGDRAADVWHHTAHKLLAALDGSEPDA